ncbi:MAG: hypothetical protein IKO93_02775 [Lentisphaeria bacterium]|nr:hypothetical protein [Lentisphaeria bacterium]
MSKFSEDSTEKTSILDKAHELDALFCKHASISQIQNFFSDNQDNLVDIFSKMICWSNLFSTEFIASIELPFVKQICLFLNNRIVMGYSTKMNFCAAVIMAEWIDAEKRAMFWNVLKNITSSTNYADSSVMEEINTARKTFLYHIMPGEKSDFMQRTTFGTEDFEGSDRIMEAIRQDSVPLFEKSRKIERLDISITMLNFLLRSDAVKCFVHLLDHYPRQVFKLRSAEEWLFTVCHDVCEKTAILVILWLEAKKPGIIATARDPWGNTLLWHTLARGKAEEIQRTLIFRGCDANAANQWGLSFRIVKRNTL